MTQLFSNNSRTTVASTFLSTDTALSVSDGSIFPDPSGGDYFIATVFRVVDGVESGHEVVKCTARVGNDLTVERSYEGAAATEFAAGAIVAVRPTAKTFENLQAAATETDKGLVEKATTAEAQAGTADKFPDAAGVVSAINAIPRKNLIINGNFDIWKRGGSFSSTGYAADRWRFDEGDGSSNVTRQAFVVGQTDVPNEPTYFLRHDRSVAATVATAAIEQRIEGVRSLAGQTATVSFYAKAGANKTFKVDFAQSFGSGGTPSAGVATTGEAIGVTTVWQKFTITVALPSIAGKTIGTNGDDYLTFRIKETNSFSSFTIDIAQVQLEKGSVATNFEYRPIGEEEALCKRYFQIQQGRTVIGQAESSTQIRVIHSFPEMRAAPAVFLLTPTGFDVRQGGSGFTSTSSVIASSIVQKSCYDMGVNGYSGLTQGGAITSNDSLDFLSLDAEL